MELKPETAARTVLPARVQLALLLRQCIETLVQRYRQRTQKH
jgi:hypothetical protein